MNRLFQYISVAVSLLLCLAFLCSAGLNVVADTASALPSLDYSIPGRGGEIAVSPSVLYEKLFGTPPTPAASVCLDSVSEFTLSYHNSVPDSIVSVYYYDDSDTLTVTVPVYRYTAENGTEVVWTPDRATLDGKTLPMEKNGEHYTVSFGEYTYTEDVELDICFTWSATVPREVLNAMQSLPYEEAARHLEAITSYETALAAHRDHISRYESWLEAYNRYTVAVSAYKAYLTELEQYKEAVKEYEADALAYEQYQNALLTYESDLNQYNTYLSELEKYELYKDQQDAAVQQHNRYLIFLGQMQIVEERLAVLESIYVKDSNERLMYNSIKGPTVDAVLANRDQMVTAGCDAREIEKAAAATAVLRPLLSEYNTLREAEYENELQRQLTLYRYYAAHYTSFRDGFIDLYTSLKALYGNSLVVLNLKEEGKLEKFWQFVGQLYVLRTSLDDREGGSRHENTMNVIFRGKELTDIVQDVHIVPDTNNADPTKESIPDYVEDAVFPDEVKEPTRVTQPQKPAPVASPGKAPSAPNAVTDPSTIVLPPEVSIPGAAPTPPVLDDRQRALAEELRSGILTAPVPVTEDRVLSFEATVSKIISEETLADSQRTVTFYGLRGEVLYRKVVGYGESVVYAGPSTEIANTPSHDYEFLGWVFHDGGPAVLESITEDLSVYANYRTTLRTYPVTWVLDGEEKTEELPWGTFPQSPFVTHKETDACYSYTFSGWDKELRAVDGPETYTASFCATPRRYSLTWSMHGQNQTVLCDYGSFLLAPEVPSYVEDGHLFTFVSWDRAVSTTMGAEDSVYTAQYKATPLAVDGEEQAVTTVLRSEEVRLMINGTSVTLPIAAEHASTTERALTLYWERFTLTFPKEAVQTVLDAGLYRMEVKESATPLGMLYRVELYDEQGNRIDTHPEASLKLLTQADNERWYVANAEGWTLLESSEQSISSPREFLLRRTYSLHIESVEGCDISRLPTVGIAGDRIELALRTDAGYEYLSMTVKDAQGNVLPSDKKAFTMPESDVYITLSVSPILYRVTFLVDGVVWAEREYRYGERIELPETPTKMGTADASYVFKGWTPQVSLAIGSDREIVHEALFTVVYSNEVDPYLSTANNDLFMSRYLPITSLVVGVLGLWLWVRPFVVPKRMKDGTEEK